MATRISSATRDRLAALAREEYGGISQEAALNRLIDEHEISRVHTAYARLQNDPERWSDHERESALTDGASVEGLGRPGSEYPEYNS